MPQPAPPARVVTAAAENRLPGAAATDGVCGWLWGLTLLTLPWVGADLIVLATGRDAGAGLQPSWLLMGLTWLLSLRRTVWRDVPRRWWWCVAAAGAAVLVSGAGLLVAPAGAAPGAALTRFGRQTAQVAIMAAFALWPLLHVRGAMAWRRTARWLVVGALMQALYGVLQETGFFHPLALLAVLEKVFTSNPSILSGSGQLYVGDRFVGVPRLRGTACEPLYLGNYLLLALPMVFLTGWGRRREGIAAIALGGLLLATWSRGAWLGAAGGLGGGAWLAWPRGDRAAARAWGRRAVIAVMVAAGVALAAALSGWEPLLLPARRLAQTFSTQDWSNLTRLYSLQAAWRAFRLSPVCGIGWGQFGWHFPNLVDPAGLQAMFAWPVVASFPLLVLCETGVLGFGVLSFATGGLLRGLRRCRTHGDGAKRPVIVTGAAGVAIAIQTMTFSQYNLPHAWVALGLLGAALLDAATATPARVRP